MALMYYNDNCSYELTDKIETLYTGGKIDLSPSGDHVVLSCGVGVKVVNCETGRVAWHLEEEEDTVTSFAVSPDGKFLVIGLRSQLIKQYDWSEKKQLKLWKAHMSPIMALTFDPSSTLLATGSADSTVKVWDCTRNYCTHNYILTSSEKLYKLEAKGKDISELRKTKQKYITDVYQICSICLGTPPATFDWEYKDSKDKYFCHANITPLQFYEQFVKPVFNMSDKVCLINDPRVGHHYYKLYTVQYLGNRIEGYPVRYINVPIDVLKKAAAESIKSKEAVWFGCDVGKSFHKQGLLDFNTCDYQLVFNINAKTLDKGERLEYGESMMTHAMVLTAVSEKQEGVYTKWRIENSWGSDSGKDGYLLMTDEWFSEYVYEVVVDKRLVTAEVLDVLKQEPVVLPPWDPMGSLA